MTDKRKLQLTGVAGGLVNGLFGGGGGTAVVPLLTCWCGMEEKRAFATCIAVIFPFCTLSATVYLFRTDFPFSAALPYLAGGLIGGLVGGLLLPWMQTQWLRRIFAVFLLYGGVRYLL